VTALPQRADARRNRAALVAAARVVFAEHGLDASLDEIARRAGVGNATLYRQFADRRGLIAAVFTARLGDHVAAVEAALDAIDPWEGFVGCITTACAMQVADRGFADLITMSMPDNDRVEELRLRSYRGFVELVRRAKAAGALRADFAPEDLVVLLMANAGLLQRTAEHAPAASRRLVALAIDGFRAAAAHAAPAPPGKAAMLRSMRALTDSLTG
jgi:AcrR family transcriptional regulator